MEFQNYMYAPSFIESDAAQFLDLNWIEVLALSKFLEQKILYVIALYPPSIRPSMSSDPIHDRIHASGSNTLTISVKSELQLISLSRVSGAVKLRTLNQGGREILELISESEAEDSDPDCDVEVTAALMRASSRFSSTIPQSDAMDTDDRGPDEGDARQEAEEGTSVHTLWQDEITSFVRTGQFSVAQKLKVQRIKYLPELPSVWPIPRVPTAFVIDLTDERYDITDNDGDLLPVDCMVGTHHRPSDDISVFAFLTPANAMLSVELAHLKDILTTSGQTKSSACILYLLFREGIVEKLKPLPDRPSTEDVSTYVSTKYTSSGR
ncbi:hypothetical protein B0H13DRAFT_2675471 [Mycena leptocephala]|nr:hypothetical protein B0H13DRAFT_2675471 [Mycena leptocephala]